MELSKAEFKEKYLKIEIAQGVYDGMFDAHGFSKEQVDKEIEKAVDAMYKEYLDDPINYDSLPAKNVCIRL